MFKPVFALLALAGCFGALTPVAHAQYGPRYPRPIRNIDGEVENDPAVKAAKKARADAAAAYGDAQAANDKDAIAETKKTLAEANGKLSAARKAAREKIVKDIQRQNREDYRRR